MASLLLVIDMQNDFISGALGTKEAQGILPNVIQKIKSHKGDVIFTRDTHGKDYFQTQEGRNLPIEHCIKDTDGWRLEEGIQALADEENHTIFDKPSFGSMELAVYIKDNALKYEWDAIEMVGLCTDVCVISNAMILKAALPEVKIVVDQACCAGVTKESHYHALEAMKSCQIEVINS